MNFNQIFPDLYIGSHPETDEDIDRLQRELGVTAVLCLQTDDDFDALECDWNQLQSGYRRAKIRLRRVPVRDFDSDDLRKNLPACVRALCELLRDEHTVYVHCTLGVGRAPSVVITYLHWVERLDLEKAVRHVTTCRPSSPNLDAIRLATADLLGD